MRAGPRTRRPPANIVFIIADQLRADHLGFNGNTEVRTPNLDRLAASGGFTAASSPTRPACQTGPAC